MRNSESKEEKLRLVSDTFGRKLLPSSDFEGLATQGTVIALMLVGFMSTNVAYRIASASLYLSTVVSRIFIFRWISKSYFPVAKSL